MKIIVGLGNFGDKYEGTRHNAGFLFLDKLAAHKDFVPAGETLNFKREDKFEAEIAETIHQGEKIFLVKPRTYMNLSGTALRKVQEYYNCVGPDDLIVISDDIDLPVGMARVRNEGSSGGQKGLQNIIDTLGTDKFTRVRIGIRTIDGSEHETGDQPTQFDAVEFVLSKFPKRELPIIDEIIGDAIEYILPFIGSKEIIPSHTLEVRVDSL